MICDPRHLACSGGGAGVCIAEEIAEICSEEMLDDPSKAGEVARAVESFVEKTGCVEMTRPDQLVMLVSQALSAVGEKMAARKLVLFGTELVRPSEWEVAGRDTVWVVDLKQISVRDNARIELLLFGCLGIVLDNLAEVWDESEGRGVIGLKNVLATALILLGDTVSKKRIDELVDEIRDVCDRKLAQIQKDRNWREKPRAINLDL